MPAADESDRLIDGWASEHGRRWGEAVAVGDASYSAPPFSSFAALAADAGRKLEELARVTAGAQRALAAPLAGAAPDALVAFYRAVVDHDLGELATVLGGEYASLANVLRGRGQLTEAEIESCHEERERLRAVRALAELEAVPVPVLDDDKG